MFPNDMFILEVEKYFRKIHKNVILFQQVSKLNKGNPVRGRGDP